MATKKTNLKKELLAAVEENGGGTPASPFLVDICVGYGYAHFKLVEDIERLDSAVENVGTEIDFVPRVAEAIKHLPVVSECYYNSLIRLGLVAPQAETQAETGGKGVCEDDALAMLQKKVAGK